MFTEAIPATLSLDSPSEARSPLNCWSKLLPPFAHRVKERTRVLLKGGRIRREGGGTWGSRMSEKEEGRERGV